MANTEEPNTAEEVHLLLAFRRRKDNPDGKVMCHRDIIVNESVDIRRLKCKLDEMPGVWRIHRTVNPRSTEKAAKILQHKLIDSPEIALKLQTYWKTALLQSECKVGRKFLIDIDNPEALQEVMSRVEGFHPSMPYSTPSGGYHVITDPFDIRIMDDITDVDVKRDEYVFLEKYIVE